MRIAAHPAVDEKMPLLRGHLELPKRMISTVIYHHDRSNTAPASFTLAKKDAQGRTLPQAIAHRGYKAAFPENTMGAFEGAVKVGAHAIETDIHISKDGVIVLSHVRV
jgi:glycerophosphoryl diester phosphodiesterase